MMLASARSSSAGSAATSGSVSGTSTSTLGRVARRGWPARRRRRRRRPPGSICTPSIPACSRLMSSRLTMSAVSRSASSSMVLANDSTSSAVHSTSRAEQAGGRRLDVGERAAQVVGDGGEEGVAEVVGLGQRVGPGGLGLQPQRRLGQPELRDERGRAGAGPRPGSGGPATTSMVPPASSAEYDASSGVGGTGSPARGLDPPAVARPEPGRRRRRARGWRAARSTSRASASLSRMAVPWASSARASDSAWPRASCGGAPRQAVDEAAHQGRHGDEHDEGERVAGPVEAQAVGGLDVEPVGEQERHGRRGQRRIEAAERGRRRPDAEQQQQQEPGRPDRVARRAAARATSSGMPTSADDPGDAPAAGTAGRRTAAAPVRDRRPRASPVRRRPR